jgi:hypothetical protein
MVRQSSLFPMRTGVHFFLAEALSQCPLGYNGHPLGQPTSAFGGTCRN